MRARLWVLTLAAGLTLADSAPAQPGAATGDVALVESVIQARRKYQAALEELRRHYMKTGDRKRAEWAESELKHFHRHAKQAFRVDLDVPPESLKPAEASKEANALLRQALYYKDRGWGDDYIYNQRRAEILLQSILTKHYKCDKIGLVAYHLGDLYSGRAYRQYRRAAVYYDRAVQWGGATPPDARLRAARLYDYALKERSEAAKRYKAVIDNDINTERVGEARRRLAELNGGDGR